MVMMIVTSETEEQVSLFEKFAINKVQGRHCRLYLTDFKVKIPWSKFHILQNRVS